MDRQLLQGKVTLEGASDNSKILVYFEKFDIFTETDIDGNFNIILPPPHLQPGDGITGAFRIYYYVANYKIRY